MTKEKKYNGWTNYETWSISLFIENDEGLYREKEEKVKEIKKQYNQEEQKLELASWLKEFAYDFLEIEKLTPYQSQMINASLEEVNWFEISEAFLND